GDLGLVQVREGGRPLEVHRGPRGGQEGPIFQRLSSGPKRSVTATVRRPSSSSSSSSAIAKPHGRLPSPSPCSAPRVRHGSPYPASRLLPCRRGAARPKGIERPQQFRTCHGPGSIETGTPDPQTAPGACHFDSTRRIPPTDTFGETEPYPPSREG